MRYAITYLTNKIVDAEDLSLTLDEKLRIIAIEVAARVKANASIDWTIRESARAKLMVLVKRTLTKYGYPPDMQQKAVDTVLKQAELLADYFVKGNM